MSQLLIADVLVLPQYGLYSFVAATMISLILSHVMLALHRHATDHHAVAGGGRKEALRSHAFKLANPPVRKRDYGGVSLL